MKVSQSCLTLCDPMDCIVYGILQARILEWVPFPSPEDLPNPGIEPRFPALWADSLPAEPQRKPNNTGMGSPSLLQQIFPIQESNQGLLHCRQILYQLSYQGSPKRCQRYLFFLNPSGNSNSLPLDIGKRTLAGVPGGLRAGRVCVEWGGGPRDPKPFYLWPFPPARPQLLEMDSPGRRFL